MMAWEWTKFICCNRPIESTNERIKQQHLHNQQLYKPTEVVIVDEQYNQIYESQNHQHQYHHQQPLSTSSLYSFNNHEYNNRLSHSPSVSTSIAQNLEAANDVHVNTNSNQAANGASSMDGLRLQLNRRKSGSGSGASFRSPSVRRSDQLQVTLRGWLYRLEGAALKQWKRRWFVLAEYCLFHYKDSDEEKLLGSVLLPSYRVSPCLPSEDGITRKYSFKLEHQNMKSYFLAADTKESMTQWMNALSLASIMQVNANTSNKSPVNRLNASPSSSYPSRKRPDGHDVDSVPSQQRGNDDNDEAEEESGFVSYVPRRATPNSNVYLGSGDKYPGSYNSVGLPTISYPSTQYRLSNQLLPHQKRSHYVNAPPKPRRQQIGDTIYDYSDNFQSKNYPVPPGAQYHQMYVAGNGPAPDLIVHNNGNGNYLPPPSYFGYLAQNRNHLNNHHSEGTNTTSPLSSPSSPTSSNAHYSVLPMSRFATNHKEPIQSYVSHPPQFRLPARPHSADFLEREHDHETTGNNEEVFYDRSQQRQQSYQPQYQQKQPFHVEQQQSQQQTLQHHQQQLSSIQRMPLRSKSSLERYDPYYYKYYEDYDTPQNLQESVPGTAKTISSITSPPHRPWSDYLQQQSQRESLDRNAAVSSITSSTQNPAAIGRHKPQAPSNLMMPDIPKKCQQSQQQREESLQRLLEWKQRMLQSPLTKRNVNVNNSSRNNAQYNNNSFQQQMQDSNGDIPARPPLPKEYKSKVSMLYKSDKENIEKRTESLIMARERSKSFGSLGPGNDVCYSSDDEGNTEEVFTPFNGLVPEPMARRRKRHQSDLNANSDNEDNRKSPEYMNINYVESELALDKRSGGDGQEEDKRVDVKCEDYCGKQFREKSEKLIAQASDASQSAVNETLRVDTMPNECVKEAKTVFADNLNVKSSLPSHSKDLNRCHLRISSQSSLSTSDGKASTSVPTKSSNNSLKSPPTPPPKPSKVVALFDENKANENAKESLEYKQAIADRYRDATNNVNNEEDDVIRKLVKFYNSQRARPAPNFVKDRIKLIETDTHSHLPIYRQPKFPSFGTSSGIASDTELIENSSNVEDDRVTTKSAPATFTPVTSVLADLRKTADVRKEILYAEELKHCELSPQQATIAEQSSDVKNSANLSSDELLTASPIDNGDEEDHGYLTMESKLSGNGEDVYVPMSSFVNDVSLKNACTNFDDENDAGADADDEASRDFDSIQYQNEVLKSSLYKVPKNSAVHKGKMKQKLDNSFETKPKIIPSHYDAPYVQTSQSQHESEPPVGLKPTSHYSSFLSQSWIKDLLNPNPAYESFDDLQVDKTRNAASEQQISDQYDQSFERSQNGTAPYYYSDLLSEAERRALNEKLAAFHSNSPPPSLLSRCTALNNIRYLGTTSLPKLDVGKKVNKIKSDDEASTSPAEASNMTIVQVKRVVDLIPEDYNKSSSFDRNEYKAGSTLQKIAQIESKREQIKYQTNAFQSPHNQQQQKPVKRCFTPLTTMNTSDSHYNERLLQRRSRSLSELNDDSDPVYENVEMFLSEKEQIIDMQISSSNAEFNNHFLTEKRDVPLLESISTKCFDFDDTASVVKHTQSVNIEWQCGDNEFIDSDNSSVIELGGSQSGSFSGYKVRRRRISRNSRSKDDLNNVSDSETTSKPPPPPPLPVGYNAYGYPYYNLNETSMQSLKQQQKLSRSVGTGLQYQEPESLRSRLCVSAGDLVGKSHEELVLLLIQMRRTQSHLASTCDQLRLQMESEEKLIEIEPHKRDEHKARFRDLREKLVEAEREYNLRFPVINMIDKMVKLNYGTNTGSVQELLDNKDENEFLRDKAKAASTSFLDKLPPMISSERSEDKSSELQRSDDNEIENDYNQNLSENYEKSENILDKTLEGVQSSLANLAPDQGSQCSSSSSSSSDIEKMKKQQNILETELGRVRGLLVQSAKRLEERAAENARIEHDMIIAKSKLNQVLCSPSSSSSTSFNVDSHNSVLEAELESIDKAIDDLHAKRKEILENFRKNKVANDASLLVRASPTGLAGSAPLPEKKKKPATSYLETDVDTMETRDLAQFSYLRYLTATETEPEAGTPLYENLDTSDSSSRFAFNASNSDENPKSLHEYLSDEKVKQMYTMQNNLNGDLNNGCITES